MKIKYMEQVKEIASINTDDGFEIDEDIYRSGKWLYENFPDYAITHCVIDSDNHYYKLV